ncbi:DNA-binding response regulator [Companilactobacillus sp. RD055328]|uniref:LytR/AlgR family response regulator transcription factor n=1 Tax=Companilactobacillus sp. RD055328 TaxID=2916634 RepID=UPI001FC87358|nr:response regulator [Companilactobacillus sp. RD055328]GKQ42340.1 DNA-binding response regulator [Companilactobacillus sp. RD055328]
MQILVVDDEPLAREELQFLLNKNKLVNNVAEVDNIDDAYTMIEKNNYDVIFLDIELGEKNGFTLADKINSISKRPQIIFATAYNQYALNAFEVNAIDYVLKPFDEKRINQSLEKVNLLINKHQVNNNRIAITNDDKTTVLKKENIIYVSVDSGVLNVVTADGTFTTKQTLVHFMESLGSNKFMQVYRSFVINVDEVVMTEPSFNSTYQLTMSNGDKIPVARTYVNDMREALGM